MDRLKITLLSAGAVLVLAAWMFRYDVQPLGQSYYKTDRWTGKTYYCGFQMTPAGTYEDLCLPR